MKTAFSLIELLVVVTVIVVLLALLTPALDRAVYQAELAACAANLHGVGSGVVMYAMDHRRHYPNRSLVPPGHDHMKLAGTAASGWLDDRRLLKDHVKVNGLMQCPLNGRVNMEFDQSPTEVYSSYSMWFGWYFHYSGLNPERAMRRLGDRFEFQGDSFNVLAGDWYTIYTGAPGVTGGNDITSSAGYAVGTHPDHKQLAFPQRWQNQPTPWSGGTNVTLAWWESNGNYVDPIVDLHFVTEDAAVERYDAFKWGDKRLVRVSQFANVDLTWGRGEGTYLPAD